MFRHILVPLDGTPRSEEALPIAIHLARASHGTIVLLRVVSAPPGEDMNTVTETRESVNTLEIEEAGRYLARIAGLGNVMGIHTETEVIRWQNKDAITAILSAVDTRPVDLIVMCSRGYSGLKRWTIGSVAEQVAHRAAVPTLLLREGGALNTGRYAPSESPIRILVPLDGTVQAEAALFPAARLVAALATPESGALHLVRVVVLPDEAQISQNEREDILDQATHYVKEAAERLHEGLLTQQETVTAPTITWAVTIDDDIAAGIIRVAEEKTGEAGGGGRSDMIAMSTRGQTRPQKGILGSATQRVLDATRLPLLIIRPLS